MPEKAKAPHSSTLAWKIPWTEEPSRLQSMGSQRVEHDWATSLSLFTFMHWRRKWYLWNRLVRASGSNFGFLWLKYLFEWPCPAVYKIPHIIHFHLPDKSRTHKSRGREKVDWWWWPGWDGNWESWWLKTVNAVDLEQGQGYQRVAENLTLTLQLGLPYLWIHQTAGCVVLLCVFFKIHI